MKSSKIILSDQYKEWFYKKKLLHLKYHGLDKDFREFSIWRNEKGIVYCYKYYDDLVPIIGTLNVNNCYLIKLSESESSIDKIIYNTTKKEWVEYEI